MRTALTIPRWQQTHYRARREQDNTIIFRMNFEYGYRKNNEFRDGFRSTRRSARRAFVEERRLQSHWEFCS